MPKSIRNTGSLLEALFNQDPSDDSLQGITIGQVVDTKDPQEMGRLKIRCPAFGDTTDKPIEEIPWALYCSPFAGHTATLRRGPENTATDDNGRFGGNSVAYGFWSIPKPNAQVFVFCIDGDPDFRVWFGAVYGDNIPITMPHGRHKVRHEGNDSDGPLTPAESPIEPLYSLQSEAFSGGNKNSQGEGRNSREYWTRGSDYSVARLRDRRVPEPGVPAELEDDFVISPPTSGEFTTTTTPDFGGGVSTGISQGYATQRRADAEDTFTFNVESQAHSWVTPGFHAYSMDDRPENCRIRIRTTKGQQIIFDDTNERIYLSTAQGKNWIELDEKGNIDIFAERRLSIHAEKDINFTTDETFRVTAQKGIHLETPDIYRLHAGKDINIICDQNIRQVSKQETFLESLQDFNVYSNAQMLLYSQKNMHQKTGAEYRATSASTMHHRSGSTMFFTGGPIIHLNGPAARQANNADQCDCELAFWTNRVPEHEPWSRAVMKDWDKNLSHNTLEFPYSSPRVNKTDSGDDLQRGRFWRR